MKRLVLLCLAMSIAMFGVARAQGEPNPHASARLIARTNGAAPGSTVWLAADITADKGWHTYWLNPGDAGEATKLTWKLPAGWQAGPIRWPAPGRLPVGPIMNYGYEGRAVLPVPLTVPSGARVGDTASVAASVDYLVCADVCVPGHADVALTLPIVSTPAPSPQAADVDRALASAPKAAALSATFRPASGGMKLSIAGAALSGVAPRDAYFYPYSETLIDHAKPQTVERGPRGLTLTLLTPKGARSASAVAGALVVDGQAFDIAASPGDPPPGSGGLSDGGVLNLLLVLGAAFLGGLILNVMPCVFPILSMKAAALAGHADEAARARAQALAFVGGVLVSFLTLATVVLAARGAGSAIGWGFQLQSPIVVAGLSLVMLAAALNLSGLFEIGASAQGWGARLAARGGLIGSAATGVLAVVVAAPCTAPFMGPALGFALTQPAPVALTVFVALGLGFAAPFAILSFSPGLIRRLPRPGPWMDVFRKALAFPMYGAAAWLAWVLSQQTDPAGLARLFIAAVLIALAAWLFGMGQRRGMVRGDRVYLALMIGTLALLGLGGVFALAPYDAAAAGRVGGSVGGVTAQPWSADRVAALRAQHRPVFVNFTAAWCVTCQVNERVAFSTPEVAQAFARTGAVYLVADWTNRDGAIAKALADQGRIGVPLYLVYGVDAPTPEALPQFLTPTVVVEAIHRAARVG